MLHLNVYAGYESDSIMHTVGGGTVVQFGSKPVNETIPLLVRTKQTSRPCRVPGNHLIRTVQDG